MENQPLRRNNSQEESRLTTEGRNFKKLVPSKFTYLNSNELITKFLKQGNVKENISMLQTKPKTSNAYNLCESQKIEIEENQKQKLTKTAKVLNQAKKTSYLDKLEKEKQEKQLQSQAKKIDILIQTMQGKAADIMCGRNNSHYTRKQVESQQIPLNQLKSNTCDSSHKKVEATRKTMITKCQKIVQKIPYCSQKSLQISILSDSFSSYSGTSSLMTNSLLSSQKSKRSRQDNQLQKLKGLLTKAKSFESLLQCERRKATADGFSMYWKLGSQDKKTSKPGLFVNPRASRARSIKKRGQNKISYLQQITQTQKCQMAVGKIFNEAFQKASQAFQLKQIY